MTSHLPADQKIRERAAKEQERTFSIEAGAGTGKTTLLTSRYVELLAAGKARPPEIVAITFTEKAAGELKSRIRTKMLESSLPDLVRELDRATIGTIHSFAASLLRERPFEAGVDPNFRALDTIDRQLLLRSAYDLWLTKALDANPKPFDEAWAAGLSLDTIRDIGFQLYEYRDLLSKLHIEEQEVSVAPFVERLAREVGRLVAEAEGHCRNRSDLGYKSLAQLQSSLLRLSSAPLDLLPRNFLGQPKIPVSGSQENWSPKESLKRQKETLKSLQEEQGLFQELLRRNVFSRLLRWLLSFVEFAEKEKRERGALDFDDLLLRARDLVRDHPDVRMYFRERYRYFLIDEFQDTDPVQAEMIWWLATEGPDPKSIVPGKLFLVGDPKQSIYRFRRASIETYRHRTEHAAASGETLPITQNFRSSVQMISWINAVFAPILGDLYQPLQAEPAHTDPEKRPVILLKLPPEELAGSRTRDIRRLEADSIASFLRRLLEEKRTRIYDRETRQWRIAGPGDVAILFPVTTDLDLFEESLRRLRLPFALDGGKHFFRRSEVHSFVALLQAIVRPTDPVSVGAALRSSFFGLSDRQLFELAQRKIPFDYRNPSSEVPEPARTAFDLLRHFHGRRNDVRPSRLCEELLEETLALPITMLPFHGEQAAINLRKLVSLARDLEAHGAIQLEGFVTWILERGESADFQAEISAESGDRNRIRLMTIHKAKGLEFPVVVLANLFSGKVQHESVVADRFTGTLALGRGNKEERFATPDYEERWEEEKRSREEERRRLLYVAATRARDLLVIPPAGGKAKDGPLWSLLEEAWTQGEEFVEVIDAGELSQDLPAEEAAKESALSAEAFSQEMEELQSQVAERSRRFVRGVPLKTPSDLAHTEKPVTAVAGLGKAFGTAFHAVLEKIDFLNPKDASLLCSAAARDVGLPELASELEPLVRSFLGSPFAERVRKSLRVLREVPFSWKSEDVLYEGVVDLLFKEPDGWVVADYKTDALKPGGEKERAIVYRPQIELYARALNTLGFAPVKEATLLFVRTGEVVRV